MNEASISGVTMPSLQAQLAIYESRPELPLHATAEFTRQLWIGGNTDRTTRTMAEEPRRWLVLVETATSRRRRHFPTANSEVGTLNKSIPAISHRRPPLRALYSAQWISRQASRRNSTTGTIPSTYRCLPSCPACWPRGGFARNAAARVMLHSITSPISRFTHCVRGTQ